MARIRPGSPWKWRSSASAAEWKVEARTPSTPSAPSRARSSPAALPVKVTATICCGGKAPLATCQAIRRVIVVVLPVPAPARISSGPPRCVTAVRCSALSSSSQAETAAASNICSATLGRCPDGVQASLQPRGPELLLAARPLCQPREQLLQLVPEQHAHQQQRSECDQRHHHRLTRLRG